MSNRHLDLAAGRPLVIDGGTGSELQRRGVPIDPTCWHALAAATHHSDLVAVHVDFINAGANIITTNTFSTHRYVLGAGGYQDQFERIIEASVAAARRARTETGIDVAIAGSLSCMPPAFDSANYPDAETARASYREQAQALADLGVDVIALEMIQDTTHGGWALDAAVETGLPVWLGFSCRRATTSGELVGYDNADARLDTLLSELLDREPQLVSIMHSPVSVVPDALECVRKHWRGPIGVYPEVGTFDVVNRCRTVRTSPTEFAAAARQWIDLGAALIGGCCGATPSHVAALTDELLEKAAG
jgi:S-methylmethionine-dependent homocysteine/selenocysteine methylase